MIGGKYRPRDVLGSGATGIVYSVEHIFTGEVLALKVMTSHLGGTPEAVERFKREARAASRIRSQHVVRIFDADVAPELDNAPYLVMDLLEGVDLEQLSGDTAMAPASVVAWLRQVAVPLDKAHRIGIVHRDLKPENLFLTQREDGSPLIKILDFGIAKLTAESAGTTQSGQLLGTPLYMAPEQARADPSQVGPTSDLYALGLIAYKLLTGAPYWTGTSVATILAQILYDPLLAPSARGQTFGPEFDAWFLRACAPDPAHRFTSAVEQVEALALSLGIPGDAQAAAGSSSTGGRDSWTPDPTSRPPVSNRDVTTATVAPAGEEAQTGPLPEEPSDDLDIPIVTANQQRRKWGRAILIAIAASALGWLLVALLGKTDPPGTQVMVAQPALSAGESALVAVGTNPSPSAPPSSVPVPLDIGPDPASGAGLSTSITESAKRPTLPAARRDQPRTLRTSATRVWTRREKLLFDEALGDQK